MSGGWAADLVEPTPAEVEQGAQRFGRYLLCWELASGGMGTVYLARELGPAGFDRPVAIKRIHPHLRKQAHLVEMFLDEARITSRINHPNVCSVFDFGEVEGTYYIALEYLLGESVGGVIAHMLQHQDELDTPLWQAMSARIIAQAAEGLHAAHNAKDAAGAPMNVVHRDVSPPNLFVTYDGAVKVLDFGVARAEGRLHTTNAGTVKGKLAYMAPEQVGEKDLDGRADVWSLGVCLWEMLTGERLFRAKNEVDTILAVKSKSLLRPAEVRAGIPAELDAIVMQALERDLDKRFANAREFSRALETFLRSSEIPTALADVAEWMDGRFRVRRERKNEMVETVLRSAEQSGHRIRSGEATPSMQAPMEAGPTREGAATADVPVEVAAKESAPKSFPERRASEAQGGASRLAVAAGDENRGQPREQKDSIQKSAWWKRAVPVVALLVGIGGTLLVTRNNTETISAAGSEAGSEAEAEADPEAETDPGSEAEADPEADSEAGSETDTGSDSELHEAADLEFELDPVPTKMRAIRRTGRVNIVTPGGWADVYFRNRRLGRTPGSFTLPVGAQRLQLRPFGQGSQTVSVRVQANRVVRVSERVSR